MNSTQGRIFLGLAYILSGTSVIASRLVLNQLGPFTLTAMSLLFAFLTALVLRTTRLRKILSAISPAQWKLIFLQAFFGIFLYRVFRTFSLLYTSTAETGILMGTSPAITAVLTWVFLKERLDRRALGGVLATFLGILILQGFPFNLGSFAMAHLAGNLLALTASTCESIFSVLARNLAVKGAVDGNIDPIAQAGAISLIGLVFCFLPMLIERPYLPLMTLDAEGWFALAWYGSLVTVAALSFIFIGARTCDGYTLAAFSGLVPVSALLLSILVLGEEPVFHHFAGCACILLSIMLLNGRRPQTPRPV